MQHKLTVTVLLALAPIYATNALAQQASIKPGLWQVDISMFGDTTGNQLWDFFRQLQDASMTPQQREEMAKIKADLAAKGKEFTSDGFRTKECLTKERIARLDILGEKGPESCTQKTSPAADGMNVSMTCTDPAMSVDVSLKYQGEKAYTFKMVTTMSGPDGKPMPLNSSGSGQWLSDDCGKFGPDSASK